MWLVNPRRREPRVCAEKKTLVDLVEYRSFFLFLSVLC